ncbi:hypothetical protein [Pseudosporangium ferrugineum]|uniref:Uncharacterized protein n=1 Tax=Pseudosporangium ferrugineum TaxID=439699 RepID=A0A2T0RS72_9ACTN|nr:hypothetical protein [Pseudosporangium ferrugineum]PRY24018.1 hypothetical protein CLV70_114151 [Pseudosporangium ferrugineum]
MPNATNLAPRSISGTYGHLTITYTRFDTHWAVMVFSGPTRIEELCGTYTEAAPAYRECQRIARAAHQGVPVHEIIATKPAELVLAALAEVVGTANQLAPRLADAVPAPAEVRQVRPTLARAHLAPLEPAQVRALRLADVHADRTVRASRQATRATLNALARKGYGTLNFQPGLGRRRVVESLTLNARGEAYVAAERVAA